MKHYIKPQWSRGTASRQAHCDLPEDTFEREISKEGFFGPAAMVHHRRPPTDWSLLEGPLRPHLFDLDRLDGETAAPWQAPVILHNRACEIRYWRVAEAMPALARDADGDLLLFVHHGSGALFCDYGHMSYLTGDYIMLPRGTAWRLEPEGPATMLMVESTGAHYRLPDKGLVGPHAIFDPAVLDVPDIDEDFVQQQGDDDWEILVKRQGEVSRIVYPYNPLDAVGWHGDLAPVRLNVKDVRPLISHRYHLPPSAHTTFLSDRFVVCTFAPRPFETDPGALKVPFFHSNDDYDEVIFYHAGDFFSRDNVGAGYMTFHPSGFPHGPHPKAQKNMLVQPKSATDEYAVMIDPRDPLNVGEAAEVAEVAAYVDSWQRS